MRTKLLVILTFSYLFLSVVASQRVTFAQETTTRLYITTSNQTMIVKDAAKTSLVVKDYLGSNRAVDQNNTMQVEEYYPYGADVKDMDIDVDRKFTGHRELDDAGVYHAGARFYNQELGIFVQADKVEGPNRYGYVQGNPISYNDPTGNSPNGTFAKISEFFEGFKPYFPHALPLQDSRYQDLYSDRSLPRLATYYSNRNPYDPQKNTADFIRYLTRDIYESSPYNEDLIEVWDKQDAVKSGIDFYKNLARSNTRTNLPISDEINQLQQSGIKYKQEESKYRSERNAMSLGERIQKNKAICGDFTAFTGYVLAQNGIANAMGSTSDMHHAFGLVYLDEPNIPYVYDTTWSGYVENFYDDRMGNNEYQRSYKHWDFVTPWGNPFDFALHNETPAETNDGLEPFY